MGLLSKVGNAASDVKRNVNEKTKSMSDTNNLKRKIHYEEERIMEIFADIGMTYYKNPDNVDEMKLYCDDIDTRKRRIKKMKFELQGIKGVKVCPKCQAQVQERFQFCGVCGAKLPNSEEDFD